MPPGIFPARARYARRPEPAIPTAATGSHTPAVATAACWRAVQGMCRCFLHACSKPMPKNSDFAAFASELGLCSVLFVGRCRGSRCRFWSTGKRCEVSRAHCIGFSLTIAEGRVVIAHSATRARAQAPMLCTGGRNSRASVLRACRAARNGQNGCVGFRRRPLYAGRCGRHALRGAGECRRYSLIGDQLLGRFRALSDRCGNFVAGKPFSADSIISADRGST